MTLLITDVTVLTVDPADRVVDRGWVSVDGTTITGVGAGDPAIGPDDEVVDGGGGLLAPGLVSTHDHMVDTLLRGGIEQGRDLQDWLVNVNFSGLAGYRPDDAALSVSVAVAEALTAGVTTVCDNWGIDAAADAGRTAECTEASVEVYERSGIRVGFGVMFADRVPDGWTGLTDAHRCRVPSSTLDPRGLTESTDAAIGRVAAAMDDHDGRGGGRVRVLPAPELIQVVTPQALRAVAELATAAGRPWALHLCETPVDSHLFTASGPGMSCVEWLDATGLLSGSLLASHCVEVGDRDRRLLARAGTSVAHVPTSNAASSQGVAPVPQLLDAGVVVGLGNDNGNLSERSVLAQMRQAVLMARATTGDPDAITTCEAVRMGTVDGARALGVEDLVGSIEVGKRADLVLFDRSGSHWWPNHDAHTALVFQARPTDVRHVWIDGRRVVEDHRCTTLEPVAPVELQAAALAVLDRAGLTPLTTRPPRRRVRPNRTDPSPEPEAPR
ncbi:amidohydrolase family protein [Dermatobacter hominis]|uniref:amidohydrolase family protein n=1 Tax=Dermatobacter hominis TaxID=2884263 RepID=UPI001D10463C|nr:amidohydrolase family protein [Dermatobacter hominis]UDY35482.1 amidohydrolase family protein [Dermatobacter hominis]